MSSQATAPVSSSEAFFLRVERALATNVVDMTWTQDKTRKPKSVTANDLVDVMSCILFDGDPTYRVPGSTYQRRGKTKIRWKDVKPGLSIRRLHKDLGCHRAKASRVLKILLQLELIEKRGNYSTNRRGNIYGIVPEGRRPLPAPRSYRQMAQDRPVGPAAPPNPLDDPFA